MEIEPATFRLFTQYLKQLRYRLVLFGEKHKLWSAYL